MNYEPPGSGATTPCHEAVTAGRQGAAAGIWVYSIAYNAPQNPATPPPSCRTAQPTRQAASSTRRIAGLTPPTEVERLRDDVQHRAEQHDSKCARSEQVLLSAGRARAFARTEVRTRSRRSSWTSGTTYLASSASSPAELWVPHVDMSSFGVASGASRQPLSALCRLPRLLRPAAFVYLSPRRWRRRSMGRRPSSRPATPRFRRRSRPRFVTARSPRRLQKFNTFKCSATWTGGKAVLWARALPKNQFCASTTGLSGLSSDACAGR